MTINSGRIYKLKNAKAGTLLDLSGTDGHSIIGWEDHGGDNQKWLLEQEGDQWVFRNNGSGKYLGIGPGGFRDGNPLQGVDDRFPWNIWPDEENPSVFRIFVPGSPHPINIDLSDNGNSANGTPVQLWAKWNPGQNQTWHFEEAWKPFIMMKVKNFNIRFPQGVSGEPFFDHPCSSSSDKSHSDGPMISPFSEGISSNKVYKLKNAKSGTLLDLSGTNGTSVTGWEDHGGDNQKWLLHCDYTGAHWEIRNVRSGLYLGFHTGSFDLKAGLLLEGVSESFVWDIRPDEKNSSVSRIFASGSDPNVELSDNGSPTNGTPVTLWSKWEGANQTWHFVEA